MSTGYLITLVVVGCFTAIALWPPRRPRIAAQAAYLMGLTINEVPHLAVGIPLAVATAQELSSRGDPSPSAVIAVSAAGAVGLGLLAIARRGLLAWPVVDGALRAVGIELSERPRGWEWRTMCSPIPVRPRSVVRIANERYGPHRRHRLDVYQRRDRPSGGPVLVYLHGGGYVSGGKHREGRALLHRLAARGWVCVSADYRLRPEAGFEDHLADAHRVLDWARIHAADHGGDPDRMVMAGSSAGAHLTALLALDPDVDLRAAICLYGHYGRYYGRTASEAVPSTPFAWSAIAAPAFFVAHGDRDTWCPIEGARELSGKLRDESPNPVVFVELPGGQHGFDLWHSWRFSAVVRGIEAFVSRHVERPASGAPVGEPAPTNRRNR